MVVDPSGETMVIILQQQQEQGHSLMHYSNNTMSGLGVSMIRAETGLKVPPGSVVVSWAPYYDPKSPDEYSFVAIDLLDLVFFPSVCDYADGTA
ncbi:uncharacterized protein LY79DRAFT_674408 [Colletotrichum navitas]|uniref:Uncharacterized protein n=1 Tax=Colletotrichum navitas TaxID=681940 RepID=A0AAD8PMA2_9PEZI|nr:uncharacterized protein LY79DRAFT_674408 [Colletotrichum navitas]KAK1569862.1 hypothetical protein LY79DRAFT_674408 [Colletotrichum navitas]